jgi:hypothetical protein
MPFVDDHGSVIVPGMMNRTKILLLPRTYPEIKWPLLFLDDAICDPHVMRMADAYIATSPNDERSARRNKFVQVQGFSL